jgi:membrane-bound serine protease (ClpP class)
VLGLYGTAQLPVRAAGVLLLILAAGLIVAEAHVAAGGILGVAGVAALIASGLLLYDTEAEGFGISEPAVVAAGLVIGGFIAFAAQRVVAAHRDEPVRTGWEEMIGAEGDVRVALHPIGQVFTEGSLWRARTSDDRPLGVGNRVRVESVDGLTLRVRPLAGERSETEAEEE